MGERAKQAGAAQVGGAAVENALAAGARSGSQRARESGGLDAVGVQDGQAAAVRESLARAVAGSVLLVVCFDLLFDSFTGYLRTQLFTLFPCLPIFVPFFL